MENYFKLIEMDYQLFCAFLHYLVHNKNWYFQVDCKNNMLIVLTAVEKRIMECTLPVVFPLLADEDDFPVKIQKITEIPPSYIILLIQSGICSLGYFKNGVVNEHKVIRKYTVRKKQGKAQITFLKKKGKSRIGSRIRLANTNLFFNEINETLITLFKEKVISHILYSCAPYSWGMLFRSKVKVPFDKNDVRLKRIPFYVNTPNFKQLLFINKRILSGTIKIFDEQYYDVLDFSKI